jgi:lipopolysaccharide transport system ATP-binding protein
MQSREVAISANKVSKTYHLGEHVSRLRHGGHRDEDSALWAVRHVSFDVYRGECVSLLGGNGSGKSTVLQLTAGITPPTDGELIVRGRVLPLLAIGSAFHPELTGRENVLVFGTVLGLSRRTILESTDDIADFAEVATHLDTPVKRYSSGMLARLSCALAMLFPASIYLLDEVLATVDSEFRERCLDHVEELIAGGATVMFVSHDATQVRRLSDRVLWLDSGRLVYDGPPDEGLAAYADHATSRIDHFVQ